MRLNPVFIKRRYENTFSLFTLEIRVEIPKFFAVGNISVVMIADPIPCCLHAASTLMLTDTIFSFSWRELGRKSNRYWPTGWLSDTTIKRNERLFWICFDSQERCSFQETGWCWKENLRTSGLFVHLYNVCASWKVAGLWVRRSKLIIYYPCNDLFYQIFHWQMDQCC